MAVPWLILVAHPPRGYSLDTGDHEEPHSGSFCLVFFLLKKKEGHISLLKANTHLVAADAVFGKLPIIAGSAVNVTAFGDEALRSYWPFAAITGETIIVPRVPFVLNSLCAWKKIPDVMNRKIREKNNSITDCKSVVHLQSLHQLPSP